jgi:hypothetical protein
MASLGGPHIVTEGLVLHLDAANTKSYQSGSTTWFDKSGRGNNGTLINGPTFNSVNGGSIVFDGVNDYGSFNVLNLPTGTQNRTIMGWVQDNSITDYVGDLVPLFGYGNDSSIGNLFMFSIGGTTFNNRKLIMWTNTRNHVSTFSIEKNIWTHVAVTVTQGVTFPRITIYKNAVSDDGSERDINTTLINSNGPFELAAWSQRSGFVGTFNGRISQTSIYNRALSAQEVEQNYNATKSRFGL